MNKKALLLSALALVALAGTGVYYFAATSIRPAVFSGRTPAPAQQPDSQALLSRASAHADIDPLANLPSANPFEAKVNPFEEVRVNPFAE